MRKTIVFFVLVSLFLFLGTAVLAQTEENENPVMPRAGLLQKIKEKTQLRLEEIQKNRAEFKALMEKNQIEFRKHLEEKRQELKQRVEEKMTELREKLKKIKETRKQKIVERIYEQINKLNEKLTNHYLNVLEKLENILERIENRAARIASQGINVSLVEEKINLTKEAIEKAREAVKNQAGKVYEIPEITSEENLKLDVGKIRQSFHQEIKNVEALVKQAKVAVREAAVQLAQLAKTEKPEKTTPTQLTE